jgi:D-alanyl-lipoteichoic acid acyltransferase DltB (MBOAT superfamily)
MGIVLPENFNFPYLATSPKDFWRRWHISLSGWIRDYLYLPLAGCCNWTTSANCAPSAGRVSGA